MDSNLNLSKIQSNSVQQFSAVNAFRNNKTVKQTEENNENVNQKHDGVNSTANRNILDKIDVNDIRECAKTVGEYNITDDDIKYGLLYGRSVIAEWLC